jgi:hypothetical protein
MTDISKKLEYVISQTHEKLISTNQIMPVKVKAGILVGDILIASEGSVKSLYKGNECLYRNISLNKVAIRLANLLAKNTITPFLDELYKIDQEYGKWFTDCQQLLHSHFKAKQLEQHDRADVFWARYCESKIKYTACKEKVDRLLSR